MSAPKLSQQQKWKTMRNKSKAKQSSGTKTVLFSPSVTTWPLVPKKIVDKIIAELNSVFEGMDFRKSITLIDTNVRKRERTKSKEDRQKLNLERQKILEESRKQCLTEEQTSLRSQLVVGLQEVTKQLERDKLRLVLVDRQKETLIHQHLASLSAVRNCPAAALRRLSATLCPRLAVNSLVAIGFKKRLDCDSDKFDHLVQYISERLPPVECAFLGFPKLEQSGQSSVVKTDLGHSTSEPISKLDSSVDSIQVVFENIPTSQSEKTESDSLKSLYVYKTSAFISFETKREIEDVTSDQEEFEDLAAPKEDSPKTEGRNSKTKKGRKRKRGKNKEGNKKQKKSTFIPAKIGHVKWNVDRKKRV